MYNMSDVCSFIHTHTCLRKSWEGDIKMLRWGFAGNSVIESASQCKRPGFDPWPQKIPHATGQLSTTVVEPLL